MTAARHASHAPTGPLVRAALIAGGASPFALTLARAALPLGVVGEWLHAAFGVACHQRVDRSLVLLSVLMPVCSRCAGVFAGVGLAAALARPRLGLTASRVLFAAAGVAMLADVVTQELGLHAPWHAGRLATGVLVGYAGVLTLFAQLTSARQPQALEGRCPPLAAAERDAATCARPSRDTR